MKVFSFALFLIITISISKSRACRGCVELDELTFDKLIKAFPAVVVKFDIAFPYGDKHEIYEKFSKEVSKAQDLLVAVVGVKDYGDRDNEKLANKYNIKKEDFPIILLFKDGNLEKPLKFSDLEGYTLENIKRFIKMNSEVYLGAPGCIEQFDKLAIKFLNNKDDREMIRKDAEDLVKDQITENIPFAKIYLVIMDRIIKDGDKFIEVEQKRIKKLLLEKISANKQEQLLQKLNILDSFSKSIEKDEL